MAKKNGGVKEFIRKRLVALKRKPQMIAMVILGIAFVYYSLNLTHFTMTTAYVQGNGMGLSGFVIMLFSVLALVCFLNAFPHRKKVNIPMLALMFLLSGVVFFCDFHYMGCVDQKFATVRSQHLIDVQTSVNRAQVDAATAKKAITKIRNSMNTAKKQASAAASLEKEVAAAIEITTASEKVIKDAQTNVAKAAQKANEYYEEAAALLEQANADVKIAQEKAEAAPTYETYAEVLAAARESLQASKRVTNTDAAASTSETQIPNAVDKAAAAAANATNQKDKAEEALATVDPWTAIEMLQADVKSLQTALNNLSKGQSTAASTTQTTAKTEEIPNVQLPESVIAEALQLGDASVETEKVNHPELMAAKQILTVHCIILGAAMALTALLPVYTPLLRKIRTSIEVEANENMGEIELDSSDD